MQGECSAFFVWGNLHVGSRYDIGSTGEKIIPTGEITVSTGEKIIPTGEKTVLTGEKTFSNSDKAIQLYKINFTR